MKANITREKNNLGRLRKGIIFIIKEVIYGCHLLALGIAGLVVISALILGQQISWEYPIIIYLITYLAYLLNRYREFEKDLSGNPERTKHLKEYYSYVPNIIKTILIFIVLLSFLTRDFRKIILIIILCLSAIIYSFGLKEISRKLFLFKNFFVTSEWVLPLLLLPIYYSSSYTFSLLFFSFFTFLKGFLTNIFFDLKDIEIDRTEGLLTLPVIVGEEKTIFTLIAFTPIPFLVLAFGIYQGILPSVFLILLLSVFFDYAYLLTALKHKISFSKLYFIAGSEFFFWLLLLSISCFLK